MAEKSRKQLEWIDSAGGPYLVVPAKYADSWEANDPPSGGRVVEATFRIGPNEPATDYEAACSIQGLIGTVPVGRGQALVLGEQPRSTAYLRTPQGQHFLLRWGYSNSETEMLSFFRTVRTRMTLEDAVEWRHPGGPVLLMDSVDTVRDPMTKPSEFALSRGQYQVSTTQAKEGSNHLVFHQLQRLR